MMKHLFFLFFVFFSFPLFAIKESQFHLVHKLLDQKNFYQIGKFVGERGKILKYAKFGKKTGSKGSLVFVNGHGENLFNYIELFYDLNLRGYSPIYTYDHRGQGFSERLLKIRTLGHVESYDHYISDLDNFIEQIVLRDKKNDFNNLFIMSHSMGGSVVAGYLEKYSEKKYFKAAILSSPLMGLVSNLPFFIERTVLYFLKAICMSDRFCMTPIWDPNGTISEEKRIPYLTSSKKRFYFTRHDIHKKYPRIFVGQPNYHWVIETFKINDRLLKDDQIQKIQIPVLLLQATKDKIVSNKAQDRFCKKIPGRCFLKKIQGAHELFSERDELRDQAINTALKFISDVKNGKL